MSDKYRYEIKFVLNEQALTSFMSWMYLHTDCRKKYPNRVVNSIYFDDVNFSSVRDNLAGVPNRLKTRLRWYQSGEQNVSSIPILEQKVKAGRLGSKSAVKIHRLKDTLYSSTFMMIIKKIKQDLPHDHFFSLEYLVPTLNVSYTREYYENSSGLRITVDQEIKFQSHLAMHHKLGSAKHMTYRSKIVELKFDPSYKNDVVDLIRPLNISPVRHSKYLTGLSMFGQVNYL